MTLPITILAGRKDRSVQNSSIISFDVLLGVSEVLDISLDVLIKGKRHISPQALQLIGQMRIALDQLEGNERNPD